MPTRDSGRFFHKFSLYLARYSVYNNFMYFDVFPFSSENDPTAAETRVNAVGTRDIYFFAAKQKNEEVIAFECTQI